MKIIDRAYRPLLFFQPQTSKQATPARVFYMYRSLRFTDSRFHTTSGRRSLKADAEIAVMSISAGQCELAVRPSVMRQLADGHDIGYLEIYQVTASEFAIDCQIEERQIT